MGYLTPPWVRAGTRISLQRRVLRLGKPPRRWKTPTFSESVQRKITEVHVQGRPLNCVTGTKSRFYGEDGEQCGVEQLALQYYAGEGGGWQGIHAESGIWLTIFGLLMWDIMFTDVPNVFRNLYQVEEKQLLVADVEVTVREDAEATVGEETETEVPLSEQMHLDIARIHEKIDSFTNLVACLIYKYLKNENDISVTFVYNMLMLVFELMESGKCTRALGLKSFPWGSRTTRIGFFLKCHGIVDVEGLMMDIVVAEEEITRWPGT
ncbi:hypothetical protein POM88_014230 [Heracleum sosnowskyi]|uniref:Fanconi-associated nuclease n=1 Tax=Heracleum sosnowskyi TaxID=360622 RepID=A0AAD8J1K4_9APIA|nr:hypothetical protein POM88_014230 [Heracleum sosnowskyi]